MRTVYTHCCGVDVHKKTVVACLVTPTGSQARTFGTTTAELRELSGWLLEAGCQMVAMESTGVYWKPIYNVLEGAGLPAMVVNAKHMKAVPGRKTDVKDAEWIADLLRHGLLRASFIPERSHRERQELVRYRRELISERAREANRLQKVLEGANIKLASVVSNVLGVAGRAMLDAMAQGEDEPSSIAQQATTRLKVAPVELERALDGVIGAHQRFLLSTQLQHIDFLTEQIGTLDQRIAEAMRPFAEALHNLDTIPGVGQRIAEEILAAIGTDMSRFPTHRHLASWAKLCPGTSESAGKRTPTSIGKGSPYLRVALVEAAWAAARTKNTYLSALYRRLAPRKGPKRAAIAVAHAILVIVYHLLKKQEVYKDMGANYFDQRDEEQVVRRLVRRIEKLDRKVTVERVGCSMA
ncbi:MAG: IS110 family transposase [Pseudonocardiaceae bacterium]